MADLPTSEPGAPSTPADPLGPLNPPLRAENPDLASPPSTDAGTVPNLKFPFELAHTRVLSGGWARQVTTRELPVATELAGVNMRLDPGAYRELHWHKEAEWAYMIGGRARVTLLDEAGALYVDDVGEGDLWYFPPGLPHSIQALAEGCEFLLVFDSGDFSEDETFLITDWMAHTPREVLAQNFGVPAEAFDALPGDVEHSRYIFPGRVPGEREQDAPAFPVTQPARPFTWRLSAQSPTQVPGGQVRITDSRNFTVAERIAAALVEVEPGGMRELHWHANADEWQYYLQGSATMTVFASSGRARTFDYAAGDVGYVPFAMGHHIINTGDRPLRFLEMFRADHFSDISLSQWMGTLPREMVRAHLNLDEATLDALPQAKRVIVPGPTGQR